MFVLSRTCKQDLYLYNVSLTVCTLSVLTTQFVHCIIVTFASVCKR